MFFEGIGRAVSPPSRRIATPRPSPRASVGRSLRRRSASRRLDGCGSVHSGCTIAVSRHRNSFDQAMINHLIKLAVCHNQSSYNSILQDIRRLDLSPQTRWGIIGASHEAKNCIYRDRSHRPEPLSPARGTPCSPSLSRVMRARGAPRLRPSGHDERPWPCDFSRCPGFRGGWEKLELGYPGTGTGHESGLNQSREISSKS
jgi:hypothetical protein